jgi:flavin reductase (DIM6/NTAB) family NADH-FMN oxidoreductase RutF
MSSPTAARLTTATATTTGAGTITAAESTAEVLEGVSYERFRAIMGSFASGISIITSIGADGQAAGMTCSAVCSVSADPPLLLSCVKFPSSTLEAIKWRGSFVVNFLDAQAREVSDLFASRQPEKFEQVRWQPGPLTELPVLERTLAHAECLVAGVMDAGDHVIVLGKLIGGEADIARYPLGYWRGSYVRVFRLNPSARG